MRPLLLALLTACGASGDGPLGAIGPHGSLAQEILGIESAVYRTRPAMYALLDDITARVRERLDGDAELAHAPTPIARARRTFALIDAVLTELHFAYPGRGYVDSLHEGLSPVSVDATHRAELAARMDNGLRYDAVRGNTSAAFYLADCDVFSEIYVSLGETLGLPISMIEIPGGPHGGVGHAYVAWTLPDGGLVRWEADRGMQRGADDDVDHFAATPPMDLATAIATRAYAVPMTRDELLGFVHFNVGSELSARGDDALALAEYRRSIELMPARPKARDEAAFLLAASSDPSVRDPVAAVKMAEALVAQWPNGSANDTLATAYAASGRWSEAVVTEKRAVSIFDPDAGPNRYWAARLASFERCQPYVMPRAQEALASSWADSLADFGWKKPEREPEETGLLAPDPPPDLCPAP